MNNFSKLGFILATLGSSIGLGHIWRFTYIAAEGSIQGRGGGFVIMFVVFTLFIGIPIVVAKMIIGNKTQKNVVAAFNELDTTTKKHWSKAGIMIVGGPIILTFYAMVLGWVFYYTFVVSFNLPHDAAQAGELFENLVSNKIPTCIISFAICIFTTGYIVSKGVKNGLEKYNFILMPVLFTIFIGLLIYAMTMESFSRSVEFLFTFHISDLFNPNVIMLALAQTFFSLSLGVGTIITYSSSAKKGENLLSSTIWIGVSGIIISIIAGLIIFTFTYEYGRELSGDPGMFFKSLSIVFGEMPNGWIVSFLFFIALLFAGIASAISILEPLVAYMADTYKMSRSKIVYSACFIIFIVGIFVILSMTKDYGKYLTFASKSLFDWLDFITSGIIMPAGAFSALIFLSFAIGKQRVYKFARGFMSRKVFNIWYFIVKYIAPIVIIVVLVVKFIDTFYSK